MSLSPTKRSLAFCREQGWTVGVAERWNGHAGVRQDLLGFLDLVALDGAPGVLGLQVTTSSNASERMRKIEALPAARAWLESGARIEVWSWAKRGARGERKRWTVRRVEAVLHPDRVEWSERAA